MMQLLKHRKVGVELGDFGYPKFGSRVCPLTKNAGESSMPSGSA